MQARVDPAPEQPNELSKEQKRQLRKEQKLAWKRGRVVATRLVDAIVADGNVDGAERPDDCPEPAWHAAVALAKRLCLDVDAQSALRLGARASAAPAEGDNGERPPCPDKDLAVAVKIMTRVLQVSLVLVTPVTGT